MLKRILRNRFNIWLYRKLPVDWAIPLAKKVSSHSRGHTSGREMAFLQDYEDYAVRKLSDGYDAVLIGHSEEHLVLETNHADSISLGQPFLMFPRHICPTVALYESATVIRDGGATGEVWSVTARNRC